MAKIQELKQRFTCHDVLDALGAARPGGKGNYKSPHHDDKSPSLSVQRDGGCFKDWSNEGDPQASGDILDLVMYWENIDDKGDALRRLHELMNVPFDKPAADAPVARKSQVEWVADKCGADTRPAVDYLVNERSLTEEVVERAIRRRAVGFNSWRSDTILPGEPLHGGPAAAFIVRAMNPPGQVVAVDTRYFDAALNGGVKTQAMGEKQRYPWFSDLRELMAADTVYVVESPINALTAECAGFPRSAALAVRGTGNIETIDWRFLAGKKVIICMDNDEPNDKGHCPGQAAAWRLHEILTGLNIASFMVDQLLWGDFGWNDLNDIIQDAGPDEVKKRLRKIEPWLIPGLPGHGDVEVKKALEDRGNAKSRVWLPTHDYMQYWKFRCKEDFVTFVKKVEEDEESGHSKKQFQDVCGFRVASVSRVRIASTSSVMSGEKDLAPNTVFSVSVQTPRHGSALQRRVFEDERLHNIDQWKKFGPVYSPAVFSRMINILERTADLGARDAINFVGLAWRDGQLIVNEGPDCYFTEPEKQCPYHNLQFPRGPVSDARTVIEAYHETFQKNAALQLLVWGLGGHLKAFLGFWPHMTIQADKGSGKSTVIKRLERSIGFTMLSGQSIQTEYRLLTSISSTSHPIGWEELSAREQRVIDKAVAMLQENYQYTKTNRGSDMTEYVLTAPVLLAGEDVPVKEITGKIVRCELLSERRGALMRDDLPRFPVYEWLTWLSKLKKPAVKALYSEVFEWVRSKSCDSGDDVGALRMTTNYAAIITAWRLLSEFAGVARNYGHFVFDAIETMNNHITETSPDREPWVWITSRAISDMDAGRFSFPFVIEAVEREVDGVMQEQRCLVVRHTHIMDHIQTSPHLRDIWNSLSVKTAAVYRRQLSQAGVIWREPVERTILSRRTSNMLALNLDVLAQYGLHPTEREQMVG